MCVGLVLHYVTVVQAKSPKVASEFSPWFQNLLDFHLFVNESSVIHRLQITFLFVLVFTTYSFEYEGESTFSQYGSVYVLIMMHVCVILSHMLIMRLAIYSVVLHC